MPLTSLDPITALIVVDLQERIVRGTVNVLWGSVNLVVGYVPVCRVGEFGLRRTSDVVALGLGALVLILPMALHSAVHLGPRWPSA